jgi:hypothetical protein
MTQIDKLLSVCRSYVGTCESPASSNLVKFNDWYYGRSGVAAAWCSTSALNAFYDAGLQSLVWPTLNEARKAVAEGARNWVRFNRPKNGAVVSSGYKPGDVVTFDFTGARKTVTHVGIVESVSPDGATLTTYEGNTSGDDKGSQSNGGAYCRKVRNVKYVVSAYRPSYATETPGELAIAELVKLGRITSPNIWTKLTDGRGDDDVANLGFVFVKWLADAKKADGVR